MAASSSDLHLYIGNKNYSSWSMRPWLALKATGLPFRETVLPLFTEETNAFLAVTSPNKKAPFLVVGDQKIWDSLAIIEFLAELAPSAGLWPQDQRTRAHARSISAEMHSGFQALREQCGMNIRRRYNNNALSEATKADVARIEALWADCRAHYGAGGPFLFGAFSAADCMYAPVVTRFVTYGISLNPTSQAYVEAVCAHPVVAQWIADAEVEPWTIKKYEF